MSRYVSGEFNRMQAVFISEQHHDKIVGDNPVKVIGAAITDLNARHMGVSNNGADILHNV